MNHNLGMIIVDLFQDRHGPSDVGEGTEISSVAENFFERFGFTINPAENPNRIIADEILLCGNAPTLEKLFFKF